MSHAVRFINNDIIYLAKKHYCPDCGSELKVIKASKVLNSRSQEAKEMPKIFSKTIVGSRGIKVRSYDYAGDVKYVWKEFSCENCHRQISVEEMKRIEDMSIKGEDISPDEAKRIKVKRFIFNKALPFIIFALAAIIWRLFFE